MKHAAADEASAFLKVAMLRYKAVFTFRADQGQNFQGPSRSF